MDGTLTFMVEVNQENHKQKSPKLLEGTESRRISGKRMSEDLRSAETQSIIKSGCRVAKNDSMTRSFPERSPGHLETLNTQLHVPTPSQANEL